MDFSQLSDAYLYLSTSSFDLKNRAEKLSGCFKKDELDSIISGVSRCVFYQLKKEEGGKIIYHSSVINNQLKIGETYSLIPDAVIDNDFDSLITQSYYKNNEFVVISDYFSIFNHYYFDNGQTFIASNNIFLIAKLLELDIDETAYYETLFFRYPKGSRTFFNGINCLKPFQHIVHTPHKGLVLSQGIELSNLYFKHQDDPLDDVKKYFTQIKPHLNPEKTFLSFSGGTDSMTVLAALLNEEIDFSLLSFFGHNNWDTHRIKSLADKIKVPLNFLHSYQNISLNDDLTYILLTNGYSPSTHFYKFYQQLPEASSIFDGYSILLGDWSDAFLYPPYKQVLKGDNPVKVVNEYLFGFNKDFKKNMIEFLMNHHKEKLINGNTEEALISMQRYSLDFVPSRILSGVFSISDHFGHQSFSFFLTRKFLNFIYSNKYGVFDTFSARHDYTKKPVKLPLAILTKEMNKMVYKLKMDHGYSFRDMLENPEKLNYKSKINSYKKRLYFLLRGKENIYQFRQQQEINYAIKLPIQKDLEAENINPYAIQGLNVLNGVKEVMNQIIF